MTINASPSLTRNRKFSGTSNIARDMIISLYIDQGGEPRGKIKPIFGSKPNRKQNVKK